MSSNLTRTDKVTTGDLVVIWQNTNSDYRGLPATDLLAFIQENITVDSTKLTQYAAPSATGFSVQINDDSRDVWLVLTPGGSYAVGTLVLPAVANAIEGQEILVNCTQVITTLTISGNGATVTGAPTTLAANDYFTLRFEPVTDTWYRVG